MSPISSRNIVPPFAIRNFPSFLSSAPVKEPFSCPNSSLSKSSEGIAGQLTDMSGFLFRLLVSCMNLAVRFFPVPLSPYRIVITSFSCI